MTKIRDAGTFSAPSRFAPCKLSDFGLLPQLAIGVSRAIHKPTVSCDLRNPPLVAPASGWLFTIRSGVSPFLGLLRFCWLLPLLLWLPSASAQLAASKIAKIEVQHVGPASVSDELVRANVRVKPGD